MRAEWRTHYKLDCFVTLAMTRVLVVPSSPPLEGWRECDGVVERVRNNKISAFRQKTTSPFGYSSTGGELRPQQERSKFPSGGGVSAGRGGLLVGSRCSHCLVPIPAFAHPQNLAILRGSERE